jgi:hypothetical protein
MSIKRTVDLAVGSITWTPVNDAGESTGSALTIYVADTDPAIQRHAMFHGFAQKIGDAGALAAGSSDLDRLAAMRVVAEHLESAGPDEWNRKPTGTGAGADGLLVRALVELTGAPRDDIRARCAALSKKEQDALRRTDEVAPIIARLRPTPKVDESAKSKAADFLAALKK